MTKAEVEARILERQRLADEIDAALPEQKEVVEDHVIGWRLSLCASAQSPSGVVVSSVIKLNGKDEWSSSNPAVRKRIAELLGALVDWEEGEGAWPLARPEFKWPKEAPSETAAADTAQPVSTEPAV